MTVMLCFKFSRVSPISAKSRATRYRLARIPPIHSSASHVAIAMRVVEDETTHTFSTSSAKNF
jgi:hypothetical protein